MAKRNSTGEIELPKKKRFKITNEIAETCTSLDDLAFLRPATLTSIRKFMTDLSATASASRVALFWGKSGSGKTSAAYACARELHLSPVYVELWQAHPTKPDTVLFHEQDPESFFREHLMRRRSLFGMPCFIFDNIEDYSPVILELLAKYTKNDYWVHPCLITSRREIDLPSCKIQFFRPSVSILTSISSPSIRTAIQRVGSGQDGVNMLQLQQVLAYRGDEGESISDEMDYSATKFDLIRTLLTSQDHTIPVSSELLRLVSILRSQVKEKPGEHERQDSFAASFSAWDLLSSHYFILKDDLDYIASMAIRSLHLPNIHQQLPDLLPLPEEQSCQWTPELYFEKALLGAKL